MKYNDLKQTQGGFGIMETLTPANILDMSEEEVVALADSLSDPCKVSVKVRLNLIKNMYKCFGYDLTKDLLLSLLIYSKEQLILAPAGGGKTTTVHIKLLYLKTVWEVIHGRKLTPSECLCLAYNRENKPQMEQKHAQLLYKLTSKGFVTTDEDGSALFVNSGVYASTMHAFSNSWITQNSDALKIGGYSLISPELENSIINSSVRRIKKSNPKERLDIKPDKVKLVYDLMHGLQLTLSDISYDDDRLYDAIANSGCTPEMLVQIFTDYDQMKKFHKKYDFTDQLVLMNRLLEKVDNIKESIHILFPVLIVDEIQDFTPLMMSILQKMVGPKTMLVCIGDEDQSIYSFRGADIDNAVRFKDKFPNSKIFQLVYNRRCRSKILESAAKVIGLNKNRFQKTLVASREGGEVRPIPYSSEAEILDKVCDELSKLSYEDQLKTVLCVREKIYGQPITKALFDRRIVYHTFNAAKFEDHEVFRSFIDVMNLLWSPSRENWRNMYKLLSVTKTAWFEYLGIDANDRRGKIIKFPDAFNWWDLGFEPFMHHKGMKETLNKLYVISSKIDSTSCQSYLEFVLTLFFDNYWGGRAEMSVIPYDVECFNWIRSIFSKSLPYPVLYKQHSANLAELAKNDKAKSGVTVATFHSLKGLEYNNVYMMYMGEAIFPGFSFIESKNYSPVTIQKLKEAENRLAYVAMTRAIDNLNLCYPVSDPSYYISVVGSNSLKTVEDLRNPVVFSNVRKW